VSQETTENSPADTIIAALRLARERAVSDTVEGKEARRAELERAIKSMLVAKDTGQGGPDAQELRGLLGDPDDRNLRQALESWGTEIPRERRGKHEPATPAQDGLS
jgi:hypothetical protein